MASNATLQVGCMMPYVALVAFLAAFHHSVAQDHLATMLTASQCFNSRSRIPKVMFGCPSPGHMIKISRAFHGVRASPDDDVTRARQCGDVIGDPTCTYCEGDCVDDSINEVYDWSSCIGSTSCVRTVLQSYAHSCPGTNKFTQYLQVNYQCIPKEDVLDVCRTTRRGTPSGGDLTSPNYPGVYPTETDCLCTLTADDPAARIILSLYDLVLRTKNGRCRADWLMIRQGAEKHRHCGVLTSGTQNLTTSRNAVTLQFHSDDGRDDDDDVTSSAQVNRLNQHPQRTQSRQFNGFWLRFDADRRTTISVDCRSLDVGDPAAVEARADNDDYFLDLPSPHPPQPPPPDSMDNFRSRDNHVTSSAAGDDGRFGERWPPGLPDDVRKSPDVTEMVDTNLWSPTTTSQRPPRTVAGDDFDVHSQSSPGDKKRVLQSGSRTSGGGSWHYYTMTSSTSLVSATVVVITNGFVHWH